MEEAVAQFRISRLRLINPDGTAAGELPAFAQERDHLTALYRAMVLTRRFDAKAVSLQRTGRLGTYASSLGQEAVSIGAASAMRGDDILVPSYRETGAQLYRGVTMQEMLLYWGGDERGSDFATPRRDFPISIPVASHCLHAVGAAYAVKHRGEPQVVVCFVGDGGTSKGDFYEAINFAGVWQVPVVFIIVNNHWAISVPRSAQSAAETLAQKALAAGLPGRQVDGNDVLAVHHLVGQALARARADGGAEVIEALTYRLSDHTTADDAKRYRDPEAVSGHWKAEPVARLRNYLVASGWWSKDEEEALIAEVDADVEAAVQAYEGTSPPSPTSMFDHLYAELPAALAEQRQAVAGDTPADKE